MMPQIQFRSTQLGTYDLTLEKNKYSFIYLYQNHLQYANSVPLVTKLISFAVLVNSNEQISKEGTIYPTRAEENHWFTDF